MEIEYEPPPMTIAPSGLRLIAPRPPAPASSAEDASDQEDEDDEGDVEVEGEGEVDGDEDGAEEDEAAPKGKQRRVIKQRQSLAEKERGTTLFPLSRIKRIIKADKELEMMTNEACFMISVATEYFIKHFMEEGYTKARLDKRKIVNYKDMAGVVARSVEFDFLRDVMPMPMPMSEAIARRKQRMNSDDPTLQDDHPTESMLPADDLPPLIPSTNPLFPNAIVKRPPNTHAKGAAKAKPPSSKDAKEPATPRVVTGKNAPSTPHSLTTRGSARKSVVVGEEEPMMIDEGQGESSTPRFAGAMTIEPEESELGGASGGDPSVQREVVDLTGSTEPEVMSTLSEAPPALDTSTLPDSIPPRIPVREESAGEGAHSLSIDEIARGPAAPPLTIDDRMQQD